MNDKMAYGRIRTELSELAMAYKFDPKDIDPRVIERTKSAILWMTAIPGGKVSYEEASHFGMCFFYETHPQQWLDVANALLGNVCAVGKRSPKDLAKIVLGKNKVTVGDMAARAVRFFNLGDAVSSQERDALGVAPYRPNPVSDHQYEHAISRK